MARPGDRPAVEALLEAEGLPTAGVAAHFANFVVAEKAGDVIGAAGLEVYATNALLRSVVVAATQKRNGVGCALTRRVLEDADARGVHAVYLLTTTAADYFPRFGFERISRADLPGSIHASEELRGACPTSAVVMRRTSS